MFFNKLNGQGNSDMSDALKAILPDEAELISFDYNEKFFGNIVAEIKLKKMKHTFITDRGEIYHNGKMICDSSYRYTEKEDTFSKLLQIIKLELRL